MCSSCDSSVSGGYRSHMSNSDNSAILGGWSNQLYCTINSFIGGGYNNYIGGCGVSGSSIVGGEGNVITSAKPITPGKYGTPTPDSIWLNDGQGERTLIKSSSNSFSLFATLSSSDPSISPVISDAGLSTYIVQYDINNCELSNSLFTITNGGSGYWYLPNTGYGSGITAPPNPNNIGAAVVISTGYVTDILYR